MLTGTDLEFCCIAPAAMCKKIKVGDRILKVDDTTVDAKGTNSTKLLLGSDLPG